MGTKNFFASNIEDINFGIGNNFNYDEKVNYEYLTEDLFEDLEILRDKIEDEICKLDVYVNKTRGMTIFDEERYGLGEIYEINLREGYYSGAELNVDYIGGKDELIGIIEKNPESFYTVEEANNYVKKYGLEDESELNEIPEFVNETKERVESMLKETNKYLSYALQRHGKDLGLQKTVCSWTQSVMPISEKEIKEIEKENPNFKKIFENGFKDIQKMEFSLPQKQSQNKVI